MVVESYLLRGVGWEEASRFSTTPLGSSLIILSSWVGSVVRGTCVLRN